MPLPQNRKKAFWSGVACGALLLTFGVTRELASWRPHIVGHFEHASVLFNQNNQAFLYADRNHAYNIDFETYKVTLRPRQSHPDLPDLIVRNQAIEGSFFSWEKDEPIWHDSRKKTQVHLQKSFPPLNSTNSQYAPSYVSSSFDWNLSPDRGTLAVAYQGVVWTFDTRNGRLKEKISLTRQVLALGSGATGYAQFSDDNSRLLIRINDSKNRASKGHIFIVNAQTGCLQTDLGKAVESALCPQGNCFWLRHYTLSTVPSDSDYEFYNIQTGQLVLKTPSPLPILSRDGSRLAILKGNHCDILQADTGKIIQDIPGPTSSAHSVIWSPDGNRLWSLEKDGRILDWRAS